MKLIIAEKPSVALAIAKALNIKGSRDGYIENGEYIISWCVGHLVAAAFPEEYNEKYSKWNYADLPIIPDNFKYKIYGDISSRYALISSMLMFLCTKYEEITSFALVRYTPRKNFKILPLSN